uniref:Glucokinase n=2 Tax=Macrostomum lignano TaxID=282301 RepID=A0A1I8H9N6_9PLAT
MADNFLIEEKIVTLQKSAMENVTVMAGIDRGCSLTKVLFVTAGNSDDTFKLHLALFNNTHFEAGLDYLASKAILQRGEGGKLHVTGVGCDRYRELIQEKLGLELEFIDEFLSQTRGAHWLIKNLPIEELCYPETEADLGQITGRAENPLQANMNQQFQLSSEDVASATPSLPCLFCFIGSAGGVIFLKENGESYLVTSLWMAGKSFLGFGKMLLGTSSYDEIMRLAERGRRGNIDNEGRDLVQTGVDGPYGRMPASLPIFPFGKAVDLELERNKCSKEDLAASMVAAFVTNLINLLSTSAKMTDTRSIFLGGNFFRDPFMRQEMLRQQHFFQMQSLNVHYLITGHTGAVGAMISEPTDAQRYLKFGKPT